MEASAPGAVPAGYRARVRRYEWDDDGFGVVAESAVGAARRYA